ncbi:hypothetical protein [Burkholderia vietnamiensis]|uniref:hypothetical protein n=1 Tax=Burkholderia vietnamiensis TaxID=60552 RepID=UPI00158AB2C5|nr:hypothetical protein [Burkholderia vietnamiensis]
MSTEHIARIFDQKGIHAAYDAACAMIRQQTEEMNGLWSSRFFERRILDDGSKKLWPTTEAHVSRSHDLSDCDDGPIPEFLYCDVDGELYPVTLGKQARMNSDQEHPVHYASADMIANGKVVGQVIYTDH